MLCIAGSLCGEYTSDRGIPSKYDQWYETLMVSLQWRHNGLDGVSNHQHHHCLLNRLFRFRSKNTSKLRVTGLCAGNSPVTVEFPAQRASNAENVFIWWRHHVLRCRPGAVELTVDLPLLWDALTLIQCHYITAIARDVFWVITLNNLASKFTANLWKWFFMLEDIRITV